MVQLTAAKDMSRLRNELNLSDTQPQSCKLSDHSKAPGGFNSYRFQLIWWIIVGSAKLI